MEAGEYGLTRGTCSVARRLEVVEVAGLLWIKVMWVGAAGFLFFFSSVFFFERTRPAASMRPPCLIYLSTCIITMSGSILLKLRVLAIFGDSVLRTLGASVKGLNARSKKVPGIYRNLNLEKHL